MAATTGAFSPTRDEGRKTGRYRRNGAAGWAAEGGDWRLIVAGQRVQIMKRDAEGKPSLQLGTEVVASADGSIAGLLGASPGASTAVPIMLDLVERCFPDRIEAWRPRLTEMIPSYGEDLAADPALIAETVEATDEALGLSSEAERIAP